MENEKQPREGVGLALSGGGFRATLFHLGSLWRLNELGWLPKITHLCSVSGGSIVAGLLGERWQKLRFGENGIAPNFKEEIADPIRDFCSHTIDVPAILGGALFVFGSAGDFIARSYAKRLFGRASLADLPGQTEGTRFIIYSANLQTGSSVRLSKDYLSDYKIGMIKSPEISLARAVTASSAFPPFFAPVIIKADPAKWEKQEGSYLFEDERYRRKMYLVDGGVYDNLGTEAIWKKCDTVLVSDAGALFDFKPNPWMLKYSAISKLRRSFNIIDYQTKALRKRFLIDKYVKKESKGTYWGISTDIADYGLSDSMAKDTEITKSLQKIRTRLNKFSAKEQGYLINWGYALADSAMRRYVLPPGTLMGSWPVPEYKL